MAPFLLSNETQSQKRLPHKSRTLTRYLFACLTVAVALGVSHVVRHLVSDNLFEVYVGAVIVSSWFGGMGPGLAAAGLSILAIDFFFLPPIYHFTVGASDFFSLVIFGLVAVAIGSLSASLRRTQSELLDARDELKERVRVREDQLQEAEQSLLEVSHREQRKLGQELHDGLCQILAGARLLNEGLHEQLEEEQHPEAGLVARIEGRLIEALTLADTISRGLYPVMLETHGLMAALQELAERMSKAYDVDCRFEYSRPVLVQDNEAATHLYRIAQEAAMNAFKSGKARRITIRLAERAGRLRLHVADNGQGLYAKPMRQGMGLKIMEQRAQMIGAVLRLRSRRSGGTCLSCSRPILEQPPMVPQRRPNAA